MLYFPLLKLYNTISVYFVVLYKVWIQITLDIHRFGQFSGATYYSINGNLNINC